jgi:AraC family transcriptional regulator
MSFFRLTPDNDGSPSAFAIGNGGWPNEVIAPSSAVTWVQAVVDLLKCAGRAIPWNEAQARSCITRATALVLSNGGEAGRVPQDSTACRSPESRLTRWQVGQVMQHIDSHLRTTIRMSALAAVTGLSTSYFFYAFRSTLGESPYRYVVKRRIQYAQSQMLSTDDPLAAIALECGFSDQAHLTRSFKQLVGITPAVWRRAHRAAWHRSVELMRPSESSRTS